MFDIVTVVFNDDDRLRSTLNSLQRIEFQGNIIIQDGSMLKTTIDLISRFPDLSIRHVRESDKGLYDAMNKAVKNVTSTHFLTLNCGDLLLNMPNNRTYSQFDCAFFPVQVSFVNSQHIDFVPRISKIYSHMSVCHQGMIISRTFFSNLKGYDLKYGIAGDYDFVNRILLSSAQYTVHASEKPITLFEGDNGLSESRRFQLEMETAEIKVKYDHSGVLWSYSLHLLRYFKFKIYASFSLW